MRVQKIGSENVSRIMLEMMTSPKIPATAVMTPITGITSAVLMGIQSTTHWVDAGVPRRLVLPVTQNGAQVVTGLPTDPNLLPLGFYMLFAMVDDIPSKGVVVQIVEPASAGGAVTGCSRFPSTWTRRATVSVV